MIEFDSLPAKERVAIVAFELGSLNERVQNINTGGFDDATCSHLFDRYFQLLDFHSTHYRLAENPSAEFLTVADGEAKWQKVWVVNDKAEGSPEGLKISFQASNGVSYELSLPRQFQAKQHRMIASAEVVIDGLSHVSLHLYPNVKGDDRINDRSNFFQLLASVGDTFVMQHRSRDSEI